jgi:hypothetical protein
MLFRRLGRDDACHCDSVGKTRFACQCHFEDLSRGAVAANVLPHATKDPVFLGQTGERSEAGRKRHEDLCGKGRRTRNSAGAPPPNEPDHVKRMRVALEEALATVEQQASTVEQLTEQLAVAQPPSMHCTHDWPMENPERCKALAFLSTEQLAAFIDLLESAGGDAACEEVTGKSRRLRAFRDAVCVAIVRLHRCRPCEVLAHVMGCTSKTGKAEKQKLREEVLTAIQICVCIGLKTTLRPLDHDCAEANRTSALKGEFGPGGGQGPIKKMTDGIKIRVEAAGQSKAHRLVHNSCCGGAVAQAQVIVNCCFRIDRCTCLAGGSHGETTHIKADLDRIIAGCVEGDCIGTDKGMDLADMLAERGMRHVRPTLMASTASGTGIDRDAADAGRRFSAVRASTEWVVRLFKMWDIFNGKPVRWQEWCSLDLFMDFVTMVIQMRGPLPDNRRDPEGVQCFVMFVEAIFATFDCSLSSCRLSRLPRSSSPPPCSSTCRGPGCRRASPRRPAPCRS